MSEQLSQETIEHLLLLKEREPQYAQPEAAKQHQADKTVLAFVGATCEGKNTVMDALTSLDPTFRTIGTIITRPARSTDIGLPYTRYEHTDKGLQPLFQAIENSELVQYYVNPYPPYYVYGTAPGDYFGEYNIGDYYAGSIADMRTRGFKQVLALTVISPAEAWLPRFDERFPMGSDQRQARRDEAIASFTWSLEQTDDHFWIENIPGDPDQSAQTVIDITHGKSEGSPKRCLELAAASLRAAQSIEA